MVFVTRRFALVVVAGSTAALAACSGGSTVLTPQARVPVTRTSTVAPAPTATPTAVAAATPTPTAAASAAPSATPTATGTFVVLP